MNAALEPLANQDGRLGSLVTPATGTWNCRWICPAMTAGPARGLSSVQMLFGREGRLLGARDECSAWVSRCTPVDA